MIARLRDRLTYGNVVATIALFVALGGTSYAVMRVGSDDVVDNSLRSRDIRNNSVRGRDVRDRTLQARDVRPNALGPGAIRESELGTVPRATDSERVGGLGVNDLKLRCPVGTLARAGVCIETSARAANGFLTATNVCDQAGRGLPTMPQLDTFLALGGPLPQTEWTASVYRNPDNGPNPFDELEAVTLSGFGEVGYDRVYLAVQHAFRCVALPSN
jgi:hypothetical protein